MGRGVVREKDVLSETNVGSIFRKRKGHVTCTYSSNKDMTVVYPPFNFRQSEVIVSV